MVRSKCHRGGWVARLSGYIVVVELMYQEYTYRTVKTLEVYSCQFNKCLMKFRW